MIASSIANSVTFKKLESYPAEFPNMWNTLHLNRKHSNNLIIPYYQKFNKDHVLYLQFMSDTDANITLKSFSGLSEIESITNAYNTSYGTTDNRYYTNFVVTLDSSYYDKIVYFTATQGANVLTSEPINVYDLTQEILKGTIKNIKYTNLDRIQSDLDNRFIDWSALTSTGNYLDCFIDALDIDLNDSDKSEVLEGSQSLTILSASYFTGKTLKTNQIPDYIISKLGIISNFDIFMVNGIQYIKQGEIEAERLGNSTMYQASIKLTQKNAIGINVDNLGTAESQPIIPDSATKMYIGLVTSAAPNETEVKLMTELEAVKQTTIHNYEIELGTRNCFAYPASFGNLTSAYIIQGFELLGAYAKTTAYFTFGNNEVLMNIYTFISPITFVPYPSSTYITYKLTS
ncbi:MAG TPA: hypothetical protein DCS19_01355 [Flavobacterium sp.]|nr:hypothetical protein [Flavobacterium sp.]